MDPSLKIFHTFIVHHSPPGLGTPLAPVARLWVWDEERIPSEDDTRLHDAVRQLLSVPDEHLAIHAEGFYRCSPSYLDFDAPDQVDNGMRIWRDRKFSRV